MLKVKFGFTLIEILIAILLGSFLLTMVIGLYVTNITSSAKAFKFSRLRTDLQALIAVMEGDIRRAGYGGSDFMVGLGKSKVIDSINSDTERCIVYSYNHNGALAVSNNHMMGFRYSLDKKSVQFGRGIDIQANNCFSSGSWINLSDPDFFKVTDLSFIESVVSSGQATIRSVDIHIKGELVANSEYTYQVQTRVQVRNLEFKSL